MLETKERNDGLFVFTSKVWLQGSMKSPFEVHGLNVRSGTSQNLDYHTPTTLSCKCSGIKKLFIISQASLIKRGSRKQGYMQESVSG